MEKEEEVGGEVGCGEEVAEEEEEVTLGHPPLQVLGDPTFQPAVAVPGLGRAELDKDPVKFLPSSDYEGQVSVVRCQVQRSTGIPFPC